VRRLLREQRMPVRGRAEAMRQPAQARRISDRVVAHYCPDKEGEAVRNSQC
jgi:hypothetical protein